jgi:hypothetical protein
VIEKDAVVDPPVTVTLGGTLNAANPLVLRLTIAPDAGAPFENVTVQLLVVFAPSVAGLHCSDESTVAAARVKLTFCELPLYVAVTVPF